MEMSDTEQSRKATIMGKIVGGIVLVLGLMLAGLVIILPKRRQIVVQCI
jgi:hypothetical protein